MKITPNETKLQGGWIFDGSVMQKDEVTQRIELLISTHLKFMGDDESGWVKLFLDLSDGRYWELTYPESEMHGGGPPCLTNLSMQEAEARYPGLLRR